MNMIVGDTEVAQAKASTTISGTMESDIVEVHETRGQQKPRVDNAAQRTDTEDHDAAEHMAGGKSWLTGPMYETLYGTRPWKDSQ